MQIKSKYDLFLVSAFAISLLTFIFTPFTGDLHVLFAGSRQADMLGGNLITNAFNLWDLKGVLLRLALYVMYKIVNPAVNFLGSGYKFDVAVNFLFALCVIVFTAFSVILANGASERKKNFQAVLAISTAFFASLPMTHIQAEMICALKIILAFAIYMNAQRTRTFFRTKLFISGLIAGSIIFYKTIFALMAFSFTAAIILWNRKYNYSFKFKEFLFIFSGGFAILALIVSLILTINPEELQNILYAAAYQDTLFAGGKSTIFTILKFFANWAYAMATIPVIFIGALFGLRNFIQDLTKRDYLNCMLRFALWFFELLVIISANKFFIYHYFILVSAGIFEIIIADSRKNFSAAKLLTLLLAVFYIIFISVFSSYFANNLRNHKNIYAETQKIIADLNIDKTQVAMYLDDGGGAYYLGNKSYLDEYYPLPLQRIGPNSKYKNISSRVKALDKALKFDGKYILVYDSWFFGNGYNQEIRDKINKEYVKIGTLQSYSIPTICFKRPEIQPAHCYDIYERQ